MDTRDTDAQDTDTQDTDPARDPSRAPHLELGRRGEDQAAQYYDGRGWEILDRNWRVKGGEIDLVVAREARPFRGGRRWRELAIVEVKTRSSSRYGTGFDAVDPRKQRRLRRLAGLWLAAHPDDKADRIRFDVVSVDARGTLAVREGCF